MWTQPQAPSLPQPSWTGKSGLKHGERALAPVGPSPHLESVWVQALSRIHLSP